MKGLLRCPECTAAFIFIDSPGEHSRLTRELDEHRKQTGHLKDVEDLGKLVLSISGRMREQS